MADEQVTPAAASAPAAVSSPLSSPSPSPANTAASASPATAASAPTPASPDTTSPTTRPDGIPDSFWDGEKNTVKVDAIKDIIARDAAAEVKRLSVPPPEAYKAELPADLKLPDGVQFKIDEKNPIMPEVRAWANEVGLSQEHFSKALALHAKLVTAADVQVAEMAKAEIAKAGPNAGARVDAVSKWIRAEAGEADAKPIIATIVTDAHLRFYEKMLNKITSQGAASFSQQHRVPPDDSKIPGFENMSFAQQRHAQEQLRARKTA